MDLEVQLLRCWSIEHWSVQRCPEAEGRQNACKMAEFSNRWKMLYNSASTKSLACWIYKMKTWENLDDTKDIMDARKTGCSKVGTWWSCPCMSTYFQPSSESGCFKPQRGEKCVEFDSVATSRNRMVWCWASKHFESFFTISKHIVIQPVVLCPGSDFYMMMDAYHMHLRKASSRHVLQVVKFWCFESIGTRLRDALKHCRMAWHSPLWTLARNAIPVAAVLQGAGPHLCPGGLLVLVDVIMAARCFFATGNHHPVAPPGATPFQMAAVATNSLFVVRLKARQGWTCLYDEDSWENRHALQFETEAQAWKNTSLASFQELCIPTVVAITGNAIGGGVAVSLAYFGIKRDKHLCWCVLEVCCPL